MRIRSLDYHTAGEPLRIVIDGLPPVEGATQLERRRYFRDRLDHYRRLLMLEPRGHADMYGAVLTPPVSEDGHAGVLFLHNEGYSTMCGHGIIAIATAAVEHRLFELADPADIRLDTPAGQVRASAKLGPDGHVESVAFRNVPSFVLAAEREVTVEGRRLNCSVAYGGAFYAYVDARELGLELVPAEAPALIRWGRAVKRAVGEAVDIRHPAGRTDLDFLYGTIFVLGDVPHERSRNACVFADGELDRSPTGTGVSGRAAIYHARGVISLGRPFLVESLIGTSFEVRCVAETEVAGVPAVITEVTGSAYQTGRHEFVLDDRDPLDAGFLLR